MNNKLNKRIKFISNEHKLFYRELQRQIESGERPTIKTATTNLGLSRDFLLNQSKKDTWAKEMIESFKFTAKNWRGNDACNEHKLFYEELQRQVESGERPMIMTAISNLGFSHGYLLKKSKKHTWAKKMIELFKSSTKDWENNGNHPTALKFERELKLIQESGEEPIATVISKRVGVHKNYLNSAPYLNVDWLKDLNIKFKGIRLHWEETGGANYKKCKESLKDIVKKGELPTREGVAKASGFNKNYFSHTLHPWKMKLITEIEKASLEWKNKGDRKIETLRKALKNIQKRGGEPTLSSVCNEANHSHYYYKLKQPKFKWQEIIVDEINYAKEEFDKGINNTAAIKCLEALQDIVDTGEFPTKMKVVVKAGYNEKLLTHRLNTWKKNVIKAIEQAIGDFEKLNILFIDGETLIQKVVNGNSIDYRRIGISFKHPKLDKVTKLNLAQVMYEQYVINPVGHGDISDVYVVKKSFVEERKAYINGILIACEGMRHRARVAEIPYMAKSALRLGDNIPKNIEDARQNFFDESYQLERLVKSGEMTHSSAYRHQQGLIKLLSGMFGVSESMITADNTHSLLPQKSPISNAFSNATIFTQEELGYAFAFYYHLFSQIADFLLEEKDFPYVIKLPSGNATILGIGPRLIAQSNSQKGSIVIDHEDAHILSIDEIDILIKKKEKNVKNKEKELQKNYYRARKKALIDLAELNQNKSHPKRLQLGKKALEAWYMCMLYFTAMNDSTLGTLQWSFDDEYESEYEERKEFISVKPRARNKKVRFSLPKEAMNDFEKAIKLRRYVLNGNDLPYLFFSNGYGDSAEVSKAQLEGGMSSIIAHNMINSIDSKLPRVTSRDSRRDNARDALQEHGLKVALSVLQNKKDVLIKHYNGQTAEEMASDVSNMFENLHDSVIRDSKISVEEANAMGGCDIKGKHEPKTFNEESPVKADCNDPKSCIFCLHYVTFPEPEYIRKLLSLQYLIENTAYDRAESEDFYNNEMEPWLKRIKVILVSMEKKEPQAKNMIEDITSEVYEDGLLSPYWLFWVEIFEDLGRFA